MAEFATAVGAPDMAGLQGALREAGKKLGSPPRAAIVFSPSSAGFDPRIEVGFPVLHARVEGPFDQSGVHEGKVVVGVLGGEISVGGGHSPQLLQANGASRLLAQSFDAAHREGKRSGLPHSMTMLLADGLAPQVAEVVDATRRQTSPHQAIVGGCVSDSLGRTTAVGLGTHASEEGAAALHMFSRERWGIGLAHGFEAASERMSVTRSEGLSIFEIDGRPAFEVYEAFANERGLAFNAEDPGDFLIQHALGVYFFDELRYARVPIELGENGALRCGGAIPEGSAVRILTTSQDAMIGAAERAARDALESLKGREAAGILVFDCLCRAKMLGPRFQDEIDAIGRVFGDSCPMMGFQTHGEIARFHGRIQGIHNATAVVVAVPA